MSFKKKFTTGTALLTTTAIGLHMINKAIYLSATLDNLLINPSGSYYEWRFGKIYYTCRGTGKPIVLIHDLSPFSSSIEWKNIIKELAKTRTVYCIDLLGCGRSDKPNLTYTNFLYVELIADFIKHVIGNKSDVAATGESGSFILAACQYDSNIIDQVLLVNPAGINLLTKIPNKRSKLITLLMNSPIIGTFIYNMLTRREDIQSLFELDYYYDPDKIDDSIVKVYFETAHSGNAMSKHLFASMSGYYTTVNLAHCLESLNNSIFIITGDKNEDNIKFAEEYRSILPSIETASIKDTKYLPQLESPNLFLEQLNILLSTEAI